MWCRTSPGPQDYEATTAPRKGGLRTFVNRGFLLLLMPFLMKSDSAMKNGGSNFEIRRFKPEDQDEIRSCYREMVAANPHLYYRPLSGPQLPDDIAGNFGHPHDAFYVAIVAKVIAGFCGLRTTAEDRSVASCMNGVVRPEYRGLGLYKAMFRLREEEALAKGVHTFLAITSVSNIKMREFLIKNGFHTEPSSVVGFIQFRKSFLRTG